METDTAVLGTDSSRQWSGRVVGHFIFLSFSDNKVSLFLALTVLEHTVDQAGLEVSPPASASQVLALRCGPLIQLRSVPLLTISLGL